MRHFGKGCYRWGVIAAVGLFGTGVAHQVFRFVGCVVKAVGAVDEGVGVGLAAFASLGGAGVKTCCLDTSTDAALLITTACVGIIAKFLVAAALSVVVVGKSGLKGHWRPKRVTKVSPRFHTFRGVGLGLPRSLWLEGVRVVDPNEEPGRWHIRSH